MLTLGDKGWLKYLLTVLVSVIFGFLFLRDLKISEVADAILAADYVYVPFALLLFAASLVTRAMRWEVFYQPQAPPLRVLFPMLLITYAGNNLLPLRAGELLRAQLLKDWAGVSRMQTFGTAGVERLFDMFALGVFLLGGVILIGDLGLAFAGIGVALTAAAAAGIGIATLVANRPHLPDALAERDWPFVSRSLTTRLAYYGRLFLAGFSVFRSLARTRDATLLTAASWLLEFGMYWLLAEAFALNEGFLPIAFAGAAANLALSLPSAQGGVGPFQWASKEALVAIGVGAAPAAAYALTLHVLLVAPVSLAGLIVFWLSLPRRRGVPQEVLTPD
jgi:glycosyltransferase 2 family protein